jgi:hypothetical protein
MKKDFKTGDKVTNECCECGIRHLWLFKVKRGKSPQDDVVEMSIFQDHMPAKVRAKYK